MALCARGCTGTFSKTVRLELGAPDGTRRRDTAFRSAVLEAYLAECCVCGFSLRLVDVLIAVDAAHIRWHSHGGPDEVPNGLALCALHHRLFNHGTITVREDLRVRVARALAGSSARDLLQGLAAKRYGCWSAGSSTQARNACGGITGKCFKAGVAMPMIF